MLGGGCVEGIRRWADAWLVGWLGSLCIGSEVFVCTLSSFILLERGFCTCVVRVVTRGCEV